MPKKTVLITGCSEGGIGHALAVEYQKRGHTVFATARSLSKMGKLGSLPNVHTITLDVTNPSSIAAAAKEVEAKGGLDILVNNAGGQYHMPILDMDLEKGRQLFEVNVWGVIAVTQAFAGMLVKSKGVVANVGSIAGLLPLPFQAAYNASKAAVNNVSETLRLELAPLGVRVLTVVTGGVTSEIENNAEKVVLSETSFYRPIQKDMQPEQNYNPFATDKFAAWLVNKTLDGSTGQIWKGSNSGIVRWAVPLMPQWLFDRLMIQNGKGIGNMPLS
ncbi:NAD(P)-binding protein [Periconia macrospinosa]|uniref:NAD(P)-binding protein n=1 Tax=Periconia macrospinosa TaxID=97972 RepID=A0A2V1E0H8_9PLEO|nr:NAD(P)-binding protein [Periconia macrospinosa]